ncbi:MAG: CDP-alcohol phosphatidyltransferase family protein [candidate division Zixibacteria bacterium]|nr:CDP-alcohol phosphatidyltransferase family protein [candidate division Zixibacteria bacterium]
MTSKLISQKLEDGFMLVIQPLIDLMISWRVHPHTVTVIGLLFSIFSGYQFYLGNFVWGGVLLILSGICDVLDGKLARTANLATKYGALFDSSMDRFAEIFVFMGLVAYYDEALIDALLILTLGGSLMTSYVRARAEGLGISCKVGIMQRPERLTYLSAGAIFSFLWNGTMILAIIFVAVFSNVTAIQRIAHTYKKTNEIVSK